MDELISRQDALKAIVGCMVECVFPDDKGFNKGLHKACLCVQNAPTVPAEQVRHARWKLWSAAEVRCSNCDRLRWTGSRGTPKYCENCGCKMDLDATEKEDSR